MPKTTQQKDDAWEALEAAYQAAAREGRGSDFLDDLHRKRASHKKANKKRHHSSDPRYRLISKEDWTGFFNQREVYFPAVYKLRAVKAREAERARQNSSEQTASSSANSKTYSRSRRMKHTREPYMLHSTTRSTQRSYKPPVSMEDAGGSSSSRNEDISVADDDEQEAGSEVVEKDDEDNDSAIDPSSADEGRNSDVTLSKASTPCSRSSTMPAASQPSLPEMRARDGQLRRSPASIRTMSPRLPGNPPRFLHESATPEPTGEDSTQGPIRNIEENLDVWMHILRQHHDFAVHLTARLLSDPDVFGKPEHRLLASVVQLATAVKQPTSTLSQTRGLIQRVKQNANAFFNNILSVD